MANSIIKINLHLVFAVKNRNAMIVPKIMPRIHSYMTSILERHGHYPIAIGGMPDHVHILLSYDIKEKVDELVRSIKASTSRFINENRLTGCRFEWQAGYGCFSVSQKNLDAVANYIKRQQEHHVNKTFLQEYEWFLVLHEIKLDREYAFVEPL